MPLKMQFSALLVFCCLYCTAQQPLIKDSYTKLEKMIPMRDGVELYTAIYIPNEHSELHPIIMTRTPYSCEPYGETMFPVSFGNPVFQSGYYIVVYQDVRGRHKSEGQFEEMTPGKTGKAAVNATDESSDTYDTIDWLLKNIPGNNGNVGIHGISYPGFYATAALPNAHPALKAVSPQAPVTDEFEGDDAYHRGAFFLLDNVDFLNFFDKERNGPAARTAPIDPAFHVKDAYDYYLKLGPIKHVNDSIFHNGSKIWNEYLEHDTKDAYWQARDIRTSLKNVKPAVLVVGGWFDAEDMFGALNTYQAIERQNPVNNNYLLMGPWTHGAWAGQNFSNYATYQFGGNTTAVFREMEARFFNYYLKGEGAFQEPEATIFFTGANKWASFKEWPPKNSYPFELYLRAGNLLSDKPEKGRIGFEKYESDPTNPVPYSPLKTGNRDHNYTGDDQNFLAGRSDVLSFSTETLKDTVVLAGPVISRLFVTNTGTDADFVVKLIDVQPDEKHTAQLVRAEVIRGKFRNSFIQPEPFVPGKITPVKLELNDIAHVFLPGHKIMVQVQSSWFPLVDMNPQTFTDIPKATEKDFRKATITIERNGRYSSVIECHRLSPKVLSDSRD